MEEPVFNDLEVLEFFAFFEKNGVEWWILEAMPRLKTGQRGAPVAALHGITRPVGGAVGALKYMKKLSDTLKSRGVMTFDLQIKESPGAGKYHRVLLIDDLEFFFVEMLFESWYGAAVAIETSPTNYQALLIVPRSERGLFKDEVRNAQRTLARRFCGDIGATSCGQLHRVPGSLNHKESALIDGKPFNTKIVLIKDGDENQSAQANQVQDLIREDVTDRSSNEIKPPIKRRDRASGTASLKSEDDPSRVAIIFAMRSIKKSMLRSKIIEEISIRWGTRHDSDWPERTVWNAEFYLGLKEARYSRG